MCHPLRVLLLLVLNLCALLRTAPAQADAVREAIEADSVREAILWSELETITEDRLAELSVHDPLLHFAYAQLFLRTGRPPAWKTKVTADLKRRGEEATAVLLHLFQENPEGQFRADLMSRAEFYPVNLDAILAAARALYQKEGLNLPPRTCYGMAWLLERNGVAADLEILEGLSKHPIKEVAFVLKPNIERMKARLAALPATAATTAPERLDSAVAAPPTLPRTSPAPPVGSPDSGTPAGSTPPDYP